MHTIHGTVIKSERLFEIYYFFTKFSLLKQISYLWHFYILHFLSIFTWSSFLRSAT